jgi:hypothetical protein
MKTPSSRQVRPLSRLVTLLLPLALLACGPVEETRDPEADALGEQTGELVTVNGLSVNGLSVNGLSLNGLSLNGLSLNGLSLNGLSSSAFSTWFSRNPTLGHEVMTYVVRCAVPEGGRRDHTDAQTGLTYTWWGVLGLAPQWASGNPVTLKEQQLLSACLAAHVNKYGKTIVFSVLGKNAQGSPIFSQWELSAFSEREACFFGNLFTGEGVYAGNDRDSVSQGDSNARGCGLLSNGNDKDACTPLVRIPKCQTACTLDATRTYYTSCTYNGVTYTPLTTRLRAQDVYRCGDGTCQFTESCGTGSQYYNCRSDCGRCR